MTLLNPSALWHLLWLIPLILVLYRISAVRSARIAGKIRKYSELSRGKRMLRMILLCAAAAFLTLAAARPAWGDRMLPDLPPGRDILVLLDISRSMLSDNVRPTRLDHAKMILRQLTGNLPGDRFGLIPFAGNAELVCPLTADSTSFLHKLDAMTPASAKRGGTNLERALESGLLALEGAAAGKSRAVLLISDGGELEGDSGKILAQYKQQGIPVFAVGIGEKNTPALIPLSPSVFLKDRAGNTVNAPLEDAALQKIATETGGLYIQSSTIQDGVSALTGELRRKLSPESGKAALGGTRKMEHPALPLTAALVSLVLFFLISERKTLTVLLAFSAPLLMYSQEQKGEDDDAEKSAALKAYEQALSFQKEGKADEAAAQYGNAVTQAADDPQIRAKSYLNLGVLEHSAGRGFAANAENQFQAQALDQSIQLLDQALEKLNAAEEDYRESLRTRPEQNPDAPAAVQNQSVLLKERKHVEERKKEIEELKKQQAQAQQAAQNAMDQQSQQNQQSAAQAQQAAQDLSEKAGKSGQQQMAQQAQEAAEQLKQAQEQQKKGDQKGAENAIREAMRKLGMNPDASKDQGQKQEQGKGQEQKQGQNQQTPEQNGQNTPDNRNEQGQAQKQEPEQTPAENGGEEKQNDRRGSDALEMMRRANEEFRENLEQRRANLNGMMPVEKDW